ncbi:hypothetical protein COT82_01255 [Candidatus Campbellbacteria bacterium CG10_big_fil_rev_8_21_14_0_10_35_52]|uniref:Uncharacterized protein n=1 Tax=Candidatus Campbellbacteria bacterium CG10_big_fil_rev_8_21_14_0_10_35_52 TaxID=1974527 RepID=A0A2M6WVI3_9BACT|nr:MAG: hypothetical protein COT82_01255 [Candidatus Campbellbacteria bacterium CG10_big_fil_rev_8_21_14_0_10_35_52]
MKRQTIFEPNFKKIHNIFFIFAVFLAISVLFYSTFFTDGIKQAKAGISQNVSGWAWGDNFGWISFNCTDTDICGSVDYGVNTAIDGDMSGYAWSDNAGWITFNESDLVNCPSGACKAKLAGNNLQGWARALSYGDGWDGWISLNGLGYGITLNGNNLEEFAWDSSDINGQAIGHGWINFNPSFGGVIVTPDTAIAVDLNANPTTVASGDNSTLSWTSENAISCVASVGWSGSKALSGSEVVGPHTSDTVYRITCNNALSSANDDATVFVSSLTYQCSDGIDNDGDGKIDVADPGCYDTGAYDPTDDNETDTLSQCSNFFDDDGDGLIDYPNDPGCSGASDSKEFNIIFEEF